MVKEVAIAAAILVAASLVRLALDPILKDHAPYVTMLPALAVIALLTRRGISIAAVLLSWPIADYLFVEPRGEIFWRGQNPQYLVGTVAFLVGAITVIVVAQSNRSARLLAMQAAESLRVTISSIGDAVISTDSKAIVRNMNPMAESLTGWRLEEAIGRPLHKVFQIVNEASRAAVESPVTKAMREGTVVGLANHTILIARDGTEWPIDDSAAPIRDADGSIRGVVMVFHNITERRNQERKTEESAIRLRLAQDAANFGTFELNLKTGQNIWSPRLEMMYGLEPGSFPGSQEAWENLLHPDDRESAIRAVQSALASLEPTESEWRIVWPDGSLRYILGRFQRFEDKPGESFLIGINLDVTQRRADEIALAQSEARKTAVLESSLDCIITMNHLGTVIDCNSITLSTFGFAKEDFVGRTVADLIVPPRLREAHHQGLAHYMETGEGPILGKRIELPGVRSDGSEFPCELTVTRVLLDGPPLFTGHLRDLSDRERQKEALRQSESRYRQILEAAQDGILILDATNGRILDVNPALLTFLGIEREDVLGKQTWEIGLFQSKAEGEAALRELQEFGTMRYEAAEVTDSDGAHLPVDMVANLYTDDQVPLIRFNIHSIAERVAFESEREALLANEQLLRREAEFANQSKDMFLATLSHEIRTPLNAVVGWLTILRQPGRTESDLREGFDVIERNTKAQVQLIEDVLDVSRIVSGKMRLEIGQCDLVDVVKAGLDVVRSAADGKQITINLEIPDAPIDIHCDSARMQQVVWNLLSNAVKFTQKGGHVDVRMSRVQSFVQVAIQDNGMGIMPDLIPVIFDRFRQADGSTRRSYGGLGLGLSIVKHIVEAHGGTISVESDGQDQGSTFIVKLPVRAVSPEGVEALSDLSKGGDDVPAGTPSDWARLDGLNVLVVDDDADGRAVLARLLQAAGATTTTANSAKQARKILSETGAAGARFDVLVSDLGMPEEDGLDLIRSLRAGDYPVDVLPAIVLTAFAQSHHQASAFEAGFQRHIPKPVDPQALTTAIVEITKRL